MKHNVRLKDIAKKLGVSVATISKAINGHSDISPARREEVNRLVRESNYIPNSMASTLRTKRTSFVGVLVPDNTNPYYARLISGIEEKLRSKGYFTLICNTNNSAELEQEFITNLRTINVAGVIITPAHGDKQGLKILRQVGIPYVISSSFVTDDGDNYVIADDYRAGYLATEHLLSRKPDAPVIMINGYTGYAAARDRYRGYCDALKDSGPGARWPIVYDDGAVTAEHGYTTAGEILKNYRRDISILCYSDYVAIGVLQHLHEVGILVPEEMAVMGFDDIGIGFNSFTGPRLSTIDIPKRSMGMKSAEILLELINANNTDGQHTVTQFVHDVALVVGETT